MVIFPIAQSEPTVSTIVPATSRFSPVGTFSPAGGLRRSRSSTPCSTASATSSGSFVRNSCSPFSRSRPASTHPRRSSFHAGGNRPPAVATPTIAVVGSYASAASTVATIGSPS